MRLPIIRLEHLKSVAGQPSAGARQLTGVCETLGRFNHLRELIPNKEKLDKAAFLMSTMDYIKQLQVTCQCVPALQYSSPLSATHSFCLLWQGLNMQSKVKLLVHKAPARKCGYTGRATRSYRKVPAAYLVVDKAYIT